MKVKVNSWLLTATLLFIFIETAGYLFGTFVAATALFTLAFTVSFIAFFLLTYVGSAFSASVNPWVDDVRRMEGPCFNPMYLTWLFENDRRNWAAFTTIFNALLITPLLGLIIFLGFSRGFTIMEAFYGFCLGCSYLALLAVCQYQGFWKPRTRDVAPEVPLSVEAEWQDKNL